MIAAVVDSFGLPVVHAVLKLDPAARGHRRRIHRCTTGKCIHSDITVPMAAPSLREQAPPVLVAHDQKKEVSHGK